MPSTSTLRTPARGFTLIEFMLALAVTAVLVTLAMPSIRDFLQRQRIVAAANDLVAHINLARTYAVTEREIAVVCPSRDGVACNAGNRWDRGWIVFLDPERDGVPNRRSDILRVGSRLEHLHADSGGRTRIRYLPSGMAFGTNQTIKLCDPEESSRSRAVIVSNPGRPRVDDLPDHLEC